jgi:hypothetical protein
MTVAKMATTFAPAMQIKSSTLRILYGLGLTFGWTDEQIGALLRFSPPISRRRLAVFENNNAFDIRAAGQALTYARGTALRNGVQRALTEAA